MQNGSKQNFGMISLFNSLGVDVYWGDNNNLLREDEYGATYFVPQKMKYYVVLRENMPLDCLRKTAAHELGHIVIGHLLRAHLLGEIGAKQHEHEADEFASFILPYIYRQSSDLSEAAHKQALPIGAAVVSAAAL